MIIIGGPEAREIGEKMGRAWADMVCSVIQADKG
jgi:hypothetical protein